MASLSGVAISALREVLWRALASDKRRELFNRLRTSSAAESSRQSVGWLDGRANADGTQDFHKLLGGLVSGERALGQPFLSDKRVSVVLVPGLYANHFPGYYENALLHLRNTCGVDAHIGDSHGEMTTSANAERLAEQVFRLGREGRCGSKSLLPMLRAQSGQKKTFWTAGKGW